MKETVWWKVEVTADHQDMHDQLAYASFLVQLAALCDSREYARITPRLEDEYDRRRAAADRS
jgi:hypothetical protein